MKKTPLILALLILLAATGGGVAFFWPEPEPESPPETQAEEDTGMSRFQTEELMRTIGYVQ